MKAVLVTGANRGLGLEFARQFADGAEPKADLVFLTCRNPDDSKELKALQNTSKVPVKILKLDVTKKEEVDGLVAAVRKELGPDGRLTLLVNNAGYGPSLALDQTTHEELDKIFSANVTGPYMVMKALLPLLQQSARQSSEEGKSCSKSAVVNISSRLGSSQTPIPSGPGEPARLRGLMGYNASKAALNLLMRYMAVQIEDSGVLVVLLHPGWVQTDMGTSAAPLSARDSVRDMLATIASLNGAHHGGFFDKDGDVLDW